MKKYFSIIFVAIVFFSCEKVDNTKPANLDKQDARFMGTWVEDSCTFNGQLENGIMSNRLVITKQSIHVEDTTIGMTIDFTDWFTSNNVLTALSEYSYTFSSSNNKVFFEGKESTHATNTKYWFRKVP